MGTKRAAANPRVVPRLGDVVEVPLPSGRLGYVQYVNRHREPPCYGPLIRVLPGTFERRPAEFGALVREQEVFVTFFPLGIACSRRYVAIVGHETVPERLRGWPVFKGYNENQETGERTWFLYEGLKSRRVGKLEPEHYDLSILEAIGLPVLAGRIASGWRPRDEVREVDRSV